MTKFGRTPSPRRFQYSESRYAWARMPKFELIIYHGDGELDEASSMDELAMDPAVEMNIRSIRLFFKYPNKKVSFNLTAMREAELDAFSEIINHAINLARPAVQALDQVSDMEFQEGGGDSNPRLFRPEPAIFYRDRLRPDYGHLIGPDGTVTRPTPDSDMETEDDDDRNDETEP